jgi:rSAM/selenodomain-associated transferase 2
VVPALNEASHIARTVAAARRSYSCHEVEIIVVDGGSSDGTQGLVAAGETVVRSAPGRAVQMNVGAASAHGDTLVFCHGDSQLPAAWRQPVLEALGRRDVSGGSFSIRFEPTQGILHLINRLRLPADWRLMYGDQAQFMKREVFERVGGFPEIPAMEDVEMARALGQIGRLVRIPLRVTSSSRRFLERGPVRQMWLNASVVLCYLYLDTPVDEIARTYCTSSRDVVVP